MKPVLIFRHIACEGPGYLADFLDLHNIIYELIGVDIGIRRLEARPTATLCIDCKTLDEIKEKHLG